MAPKKRNPILLGHAERIQDSDVPNIFDTGPGKTTYGNAQSDSMKNNEPELDDDVKWEQDKKHLHSLSEDLRQRRHRVGRSRARAHCGPQARRRLDREPRPAEAGVGGAPRQALQVAHACAGLIPNASGVASTEAAGLKPVGRGSVRGSMAMVIFASKSKAGWHIAWHGR